MITDIALAPRNANNKVQYTTNFYILRPVNRDAGNHRIFFELANRGVVLSLGQLNDAPTAWPPGIVPKNAVDAGNGFLMRQGYTIVMGGWDATVASFPGALRTTVPIAKNLDGSPIVDPALEEFVIDNATTSTGSLTYPAATLDKSKATLTVRILYEDSHTVVPPANWEYVNAQTIRLLDNNGNPTPFTLGRLYEFTYQATNPLVLGLGFAAVRDLTAFFRYATTDDYGNPNPLAGDVQYVYAFGVSQPARLLHDFLHLGYEFSGFASEVWVVAQ